MMGRILYDMAQLLESADGAGGRVRRVLELLAGLVPYEQVALLEMRPEHEPRLVLLPEVPAEEEVPVMETVMHILGQLLGAGERADPATAAVLASERVPEAHLGVPLVGLDQVMGLLFVRSSAVTYTENHLRSLSVVAAKLAAYLTTLHGRDELAELARERDQARRGAEAANRAKDEFLALVSHELKTPLASIAACAHVLRSPAAGGVARVRALDELDRSVETETRIIDSILDLACFAAAEVRLNLRVVEPAGLIKETVEKLRHEAERKAVRLEAELDAAAMPLVLDPDRMRQVVSILVRNAINFTPAGGHVAVRLERASGSVRIQVRDNGSGIRPEALPHVFDRLFRVADDGVAADEAPPGAELNVGLAIVKDLIQLHGGRVRAESAGLERGATFTIELPHALDGRTPPQPLAAEDRPPGGNRQLAGVRVLLVDQNLDLRESLQLALEEYGADVMAAASAPAALAALERSRPDVLLFGDLALPSESVYDLIRELTARACPLSFASISTWRLNEQEKARGQAAGVRLHLPKPIEIGALVEAVANLAGRTPAGIAH
jgi:signal transduction histidine kinase/CheY-like chemotaxis protein